MAKKTKKTLSALPNVKKSDFHSKQWLVIKPNDHRLYKKYSGLIARFDYWPSTTNTKVGVRIFEPELKSIVIPFIFLVDARLAIQEGHEKYAAKIGDQASRTFLKRNDSLQNDIKNFQKAAEKKKLEIFRNSDKSDYCIRHGVEMFNLNQYRLTRIEEIIRKRGVSHQSKIDLIKKLDLSSRE